MFAQRTWGGTVRQAFPQVADVVYVVVSVGIMGTMLRNWPNSQGYWRQTDVWAYVLIALVYLPLAVRRRAPLTVLVSTAACTLCYFTLGYYHVVIVCGLGLAFYTVAALCPRRVVAKCAAGSLLVLLWGTRLAVLSEQLRLEQEEKAQRAVMAERMSVARELHDVVAHHVSAISVQTGLAGYVFTSDPKTARAALETIAGSAHEAMAEMRRMLAVLREGMDHAQEEGAGDHTATPGLGRLEQLARRVTAAGVPVDVRITGAPFALSPGVDLCVFRVIQEALTNAMKHAPAANASVTVHFDEAAVRVRVADDGQASVLAGATVGPAAHGLIGMRERAGIYGGTVTAGPGPQGGFEVELTVPVARDR